MLRSAIYVGQIVRFSHSGKKVIARVEKVNPKSIKVITEEGTAWRISAGLLSPADADEVSGFCIKEPEEALVVGQVVRFKEPTARGKDPLLVVIGSHGTALRLAPLGGRRGAYYRGVTPAQLEVVPFSVNIPEEV